MKLFYKLQYKIHLIKKNDDDDDDDDDDDEDDGDGTHLISEMNFFFIAQPKKRKINIFFQCST